MSPGVTLTKADPFELIHRAADRAEGPMKRAIQQALEALRSQVGGSLAEIIDQLRDLQVPQAVIDQIRDAHLSAAVQVAEPIARGFNMAFNQVNPYTLRWAERHSAQLVTSITDTTRQAVSEAVQVALREGRGPDRLADVVQELVGLTPRHARAVERFAASFDDPDFGLRQAAKKAKQLLRYRAENIARTETIRAANEGQQAAWDAAADAGLISRTSRKVWVATEDSRTCPICSELDGQVVGMDRSFGLDEDANGKTVNITERTPPAHVNCRCAMALEPV